VADQRSQARREYRGLLVFAMALSSGGWWSGVGPLVMTGLLLKVSGVALLVKTIVKRRPEYGEYIKRTNAFIPGPRNNV
jgi:steroid 5-alpha reductase family enzyme